jgi:hypothetical protein
MRNLINGWYNRTGDVPMSQCAYTNSTDELHPKLKKIVYAVSPVWDRQEYLKYELFC